MKFLMKRAGMREEEALILTDSDLCPEFPIFGIHSCDDCQGIVQISITMPGKNGDEFRLSLDITEFLQLKDNIAAYSNLHTPPGEEIIIHEGTETKQ